MIQIPSFIKSHHHHWYKIHHESHGTLASCQNMPLLWTTASCTLKPHELGLLWKWRTCATASPVIVFPFSRPLCRRMSWINCSTAIVRFLLLLLSSFFFRKKIVDECLLSSGHDLLLMEMRFISFYLGRQWASLFFQFDLQKGRKR